MTSFFLWTSPLGKGTYSSASKSNSVAKLSDLHEQIKLIRVIKSLINYLPVLLTAPEFASM